MSGPSTTDGLPAANPVLTGEVPIWQTASTFKAALLAATVSKLVSVRHANINTGTTTLATTDFFCPCDTSTGAITLNPPAAPLDQHELLIMDIGGAAFTANITIGAGFGTIAGVSGRKITRNYGWLWIKYDATSAKWQRIDASEPDLGPGLQINAGNIEVVSGRGKTITAGATLTLANTDAGSYIKGDGTHVNAITFPASPVAGCSFTLNPVLNSMQLNFNGQIARMVGYGSHDMTAFTLPFVGNENSYLTLVFDGTRWSASDFSPGLYEALCTLVDPLAAHGQVYFDYDSGNTRFRLLPKNGPGGIIVNSRMNQINSAGVWTDKGNTNNSALNYFYLAQDLAIAITGAANNGSGKVRLTVAHTFIALDQVTLWTHSVMGCAEANVSCEVGTVIDSTHIDLPNVPFVNAFTSSPNALARIDGLKISATGHTTTNGIEVNSGDATQTLVGMAWIGASHAVNDSVTNRDVASWFNRKLKTAKNHYTADRTTTSATYAELNAEIECEFVTWGVDDLRWSATGMFKNSTNAAVVSVSAGFDSTTVPEVEEVGLINGAAAVIIPPLCLTGSKSGLSEGKHFITLLAKCSAGTTTIYGTTPVTYLEIAIPQ
jgi:hypothetical protein